MTDPTQRTLFCALLLAAALAMCCAIECCGQVRITNAKWGAATAAPAESYFTFAETNQADWWRAGSDLMTHRTTVYTNIGPGATHTEINNALTACPSNQVVILAGTNTVTGSIVMGWKNHKTLRGSNNCLIISSAVDPVTVGGNYGYYPNTGEAISGSYTVGATSITMVATPHAFLRAGNSMQIRQADNTNYIFRTTGPGEHERSYHRIDSVSGTTINFQPPLPFEVLAARTPTVRWNNADREATTGFGLENLTIDSGGSGYGVYWQTVFECWMTNVHITNFSGSLVGFYLLDSAKVTIRGNKFTDVAGHPNTPTGPGVLVQGSTYSRFEDNIFSRVGFSFNSRDAGLIGNVYAYNFGTNNTFQNITTRLVSDIYGNHGCAARFNLWEGNQMSGFNSDDYHGSGANWLIFRNRFSGANGYGTGSMVPMKIGRGNYWSTVVGNILGSTTITYHSLDMVGASPGYVTNFIYKLGRPNVDDNGLTEILADNGWSDDYPTYFPTDSSYPDPRTEATLLRHMNWDGFTGGIITSNGYGTNLIASYAGYTNTAPTWWTSGCPWPPYDPTQPTMHSPTNLPAGKRYLGL